MDKFTETAESEFKAGQTAFIIEDSIMTEVVIVGFIFTDYDGNYVLVDDKKGGRMRVREHDLYTTRIKKLLNFYELDAQDIDDRTMTELKEIVAMASNPIATKFKEGANLVTDEEAAELEKAIIANCPTLVSSYPEYREWLHEAINRKIHGVRPNGSCGFYYAFFDYDGVLSQYI